MADRSYTIFKNGQLFGMGAAASMEEAQQSFKEMCLKTGWTE